MLAGRIYEMPALTDMQRHMFTIETSLLRFERMELGCLLEMAMWKAAICNGLRWDGTIGVALHSMAEVREYKILDGNFNEKSFLRKRRKECGSHIVVPLVLQFC